MCNLCRCFNEVQFTIRLDARLTGLSAYVIRIWEQCDWAVEPQWTATTRRLCFPRDICEALRLGTALCWQVKCLAAMWTEHLPLDFPALPSVP